MDYRYTIQDLYCVSVVHICSHISFGNVTTVPNVTLSVRIAQYGNVSWSVIDDDLRTPHEGLLTDVGKRAKFERREVINWKSFDSEAYCKATKSKLNSLYDKWQMQQDLSADMMARELTANIQECVDLIAKKKIITEHGKTLDKCSAVRSTKEVALV